MGTVKLAPKRWAKDRLEGGVGLVLDRTGLSLNRYYRNRRRAFLRHRPNLTYHLATCILPDCSFVTKILLPRDETYFVGWHIQSDIM